jgi:hypothetical protein
MRETKIISKALFFEVGSGEGKVWGDGTGILCAHLGLQVSLTLYIKTPFSSILFGIGARVKNLIYLKGWNP